MKRAMCLVACALLLLWPAHCANASEAEAEEPAQQQEQTQQQAEEEFEWQLSQTLSGLQLGELESHYRQDELAKSILGGANLRTLIESAARGESTFDVLDILKALGGRFVNALRGNLLLLLQLVVLAVLMSLIGAVGPDVLSGEVSNVCRFIGYVMVMALCVQSLVSVFQIGIQAITSMTGVMQAIFPVMLTLLTAIGSSATVGVFQPAMTLLTGSIVTLIQRFSLPAILTSGILVIVQHVSGKVQIEQTTKLVMKCAQWLTTVVFVIFLGVTALQGLAGATYDGISIRTAKFAIDKFVPIVGGMFSDTVDTLVGCSLVVKQGVGIVGLLLLACSIASPVLQIAAMSITYRLAAAIIEPFGDKKLPACLSGLASVFTLLYIAVLAAGIMMFILTTLLIRAGNVNVMLR